MEPHQVTKKKKKTTNKDPYSTSFVNKKKIIKEEKTKTTFYPLVKSQMLLKNDLKKKLQTKILTQQVLWIKRK